MGVRGLPRVHQQRLGDEFPGAEALRVVHLHARQRRRAHRQQQQQQGREVQREDALRAPPHEIRPAGRAERRAVAVAEEQGEARQDEEPVDAEIALQHDRLRHRHAGEGAQSEFKMVDHHPADQHRAQPRDRGKPFGLGGRRRRLPREASHHPHPCLLTET
jgi:hypothetical protein